MRMRKYKRIYPKSNIEYLMERKNQGQGIAKQKEKGKIKLQVIIISI